MTAGPEDDTPWAREEVEHLRPYVTTGGRTVPRHDMRVESMASVSRRSPTQLQGLGAKQQVLRMCWSQPLAVSEIASNLGQPLVITKVLLSDLIDSGDIHVETLEGDAPPIAVMKDVLDGLRNLVAN